MKKYEVYNDNGTGAYFGIYEANSENEAILACNHEAGLKNDIWLNEDGEFEYSDYFKDRFSFNMLKAVQVES